MTSSAIPENREAWRPLYIGIGLFCAAIVFTGFSRPYYLNWLFGKPSVPFLLHVHSAVMTSWFLLFLLKTLLVFSGRIAAHRQVGWVGAGLAFVLVCLSEFVVVHAAIRDAHHPDLGGAFFLGAETAIMIFFSVFFTLGILNKAERGSQALHAAGGCEPAATRHRSHSRG